MRRILRNPHVDRPRAIGRHLGWQWRRLSGAFPAELALSQSVLVARSGRCGVSALVNAHGMYDYNNMQLIKLALAGGGTFVDVGANVGAYTLIASEQPRARVVAYEPHPATFERLRQNLVRNARDGVVAVCAAVGDHDGEISLSDTPGDPTTHAVDIAGPGTIRVPLLRLDGDLARRGLAPDVVKIDVEGFEFDVLTGLGQRLSDLALVFVEINGLSDRRSVGGEGIADLLRGSGLDGPFWFDAVGRTFRRGVVHAGEDPVFVNRPRLRRLASLRALRFDDAP